MPIKSKLWSPRRQTKGNRRTKVRKKGTRHKEKDREKGKGDRYREREGKPRVGRRNGWGRPTFVTPPPDRQEEKGRWGECGVKDKSPNGSRRAVVTKSVGGG